MEAILVAGVDRIMDMARTINVLGATTGALFVSKLKRFRPRTRRTARCGRAPETFGRRTPRKILPRREPETTMRQDERIGIVGGVGPHAGLDLTRKLFATPGRADQNTCRSCSIPSPTGSGRPAFLLGKTADNPGEAMRHHGGTGAGRTCVIGMPCNTIARGYWTRPSAQGNGRPVRFVHMIDAVVRHVRRRAVGKALAWHPEHAGDVGNPALSGRPRAPGWWPASAPDCCTRVQRPSATASTASRPGTRSRNAPAPIFG